MANQHICSLGIKTNVLVWKDNNGVWKYSDGVHRKEGANYCPFCGVKLDG